MTSDEHSSSSSSKASECESATAQQQSHARNKARGVEEKKKQTNNINRRNRVEEFVAIPYTSAFSGRAAHSVSDIHYPPEYFDTSKLNQKLQEDEDGIVTSNENNEMRIRTTQKSSTARPAIPQFNTGKDFFGRFHGKDPLGHVPPSKVPVIIGMMIDSMVKAYCSIVNAARDDEHRGPEALGLPSTPKYMACFDQKHVIVRDPYVSRYKGGATAATNSNNNNESGAMASISATAAGGGIVGETHAPNGQKPASTHQIRFWCHVAGSSLVIRSLLVYELLHELNTVVCSRVLGHDGDCGERESWSKRKRSDHLIVRALYAKGFPFEDDSAWDLGSLIAKDEDIRAKASFPSFTKKNFKTMFLEVNMFHILSLLARTEIIASTKKPALVDVHLKAIASAITTDSFRTMVYVAHTFFSFMNRAWVFHKVGISPRSVHVLSRVCDPEIFAQGIYRYESEPPVNPNAEHPEVCNVAEGTPAHSTLSGILLDLVAGKIPSEDKDKFAMRSAAVYYPEVGEGCTMYDVFERPPRVQRAYNMMAEVTVGRCMYKPEDADKPPIREDSRGRPFFRSPTIGYIVSALLAKVSMSYTTGVPTSLHESISVIESSRFVPDYFSPITKVHNTSGGPSDSGNASGTTATVAAANRKRSLSSGTAVEEKEEVPRPALTAEAIAQHLRTICQPRTHAQSGGDIQVILLQSDGSGAFVPSSQATAAAIRNAVQPMRRQRAKTRKNPIAPRASTTTSAVARRRRSSSSPAPSVVSSTGMDLHRVQSLGQMIEELTTIVAERTGKNRDQLVGMSLQELSALAATEPSSSSSQNKQQQQPTRRKAQGRKSSNTNTGSAALNSTTKRTATAATNRSSAIGASQPTSSNNNKRKKPEGRSSSVGKDAQLSIGPHEKRAAAGFAVVGKPPSHPGSAAGSNASKGTDLNDVPASIPIPMPSASQSSLPSTSSKFASVHRLFAPLNGVFSSPSQH